MGILALIHVVVMVVLGLAALGLGVSLAVRPSERRFGMLRPVTWGTVFSVLSAICSGMSAVAMRLAEGPATAEVGIHAWAGAAEALVPGMFGFGVLAVAWGLAAVGLRRQD
jgi:hypothetical protein